MNARQTPFQRAIAGYRQCRPRFGSAGEAYQQGYSGMHCKWPHGTYARAAWRAGVLNKRAELETDHQKGEG